MAINQGKVTQGCVASQSLGCTGVIGRSIGSLPIVSDKAMNMWRNLTYFVAFPAIGLCMINTYLMHQEEDHTPPEFIPYEHLRIRTKVHLCVNYCSLQVTIQILIISNNLRIGGPRFSDLQGFCNICFLILIVIASNCCNCLHYSTQNKMK